MKKTTGFKILGTNGKRSEKQPVIVDREANTLGSKSAGVEITQGAMDLKVLIEQMREQIQNIE